MDKKITIILGVVLYLVSTFASYSFFKMRNADDQTSYEEPVVTADGTVVDNAPKTEPCPLNGQLYSKNQKAKWETRRPMGVMIQNHAEARPQSGLSSADAIYEAVAEGGITRFLSIFYCDIPPLAGSVRSSRIYFIHMLQGYGNNPLYLHIGGAAKAGPADALGFIEKLGWRINNDIDGLNIGLPIYKRLSDRLPNRAWEHVGYADLNEALKFAKNKRKLTNVDEDGVSWDEDWKPWDFAKDADSADRGKAGKVSYGFWEGDLGTDYNVSWSYDPTTNKYLRTNGGKPQIDLNNNQQLSVSNVAVAFADESEAKDGYEKGQHLLYDVKGSDKAIVFQNGQAIVGTWKKPKDTDMIRFYDKKGDEIEFVAGKIWISILPSGNEVTY